MSTSDRGFRLSHAVLSASTMLDEGPSVVVPIASLLPSDSPRVDGENAEHVQSLVESEHDTLPIVVHRQTMRVIDGMHRLRAAVSRGRSTIEARFFDGDEHDLFVLAVELNSRQGLPLSQEDRTAAATRVVGSHPYWSDRQIAQLTGLSAKTVAAIRRRSTEGIPQLNGRLGRDGKVRPLNIVRNRELAGRLMAERPNATLREIAVEAGISLGTAQDVRRRLRLGEDPVPPARQQPRRPASTATQRAPRPAATLLPRLRRDPSLRFSEVGRVLLRLLEAHAVPTEAWTKLVDAVPAHCAQTVADVARGCADSWSQFARQVEKRAVNSQAA